MSDASEQISAANRIPRSSNEFYRRLFLGDNFREVTNPFFKKISAGTNTLLVLDTKSQNIPEVVVVRRVAVGVLGIWEGWVNWVKGSKWGQFTSDLRGRWTIPVTTGGSQVSGKGIQRGDKGKLTRGVRGAMGTAPCIYANVMYVPE